MATGRTNQKWARVYIDGYDMSGYARTIGPLAVEHEAGDNTAMSDTLIKVRLNRTSMKCGTLSGIFDNTASTGIHAVLGTSGETRDVLVALGIRAAPAVDDPVFCGQFIQTGYTPGLDQPVVAVDIPFGEWDARADSAAYNKAWGYLLHENSAETAATTADDADHDGGAQTTAGGYMMYQVLSSDGTVAIKVQDSTEEVNASYSDLLTSGDVDASSTPASGIVALATDATVERYLRWQIALNTATTVTFVLTFVRG